MEQGYLILRNVIPPEKLDEVQFNYESLLEKQRAIWAREREPGDLPGGLCEESPQPRLQLLDYAGLHSPDLIDESNSGAMDVWLSENTLGGKQRSNRSAVRADIHAVDDVQPGPRSRPARWHRDVGVAMGLLTILEMDVIENGPRYIQWNIPLHDDNVFWLVPGSHVRLNTEQENRDLSKDPHTPITGGARMELSAGDGLVCNNHLLHWGSDYSSGLRRTLHGAYCISSYYEDLRFTHHLSAAGKATFVDLLGLEEARHRAGQLPEDAVAALEPFGDKADLLRDVARYIIARKN